ncbi:hypothetical protein QVD17_03133 [Tagetes erecta]|uniref:Bet v I/Major latex protein domain-containing protein n=1 Tax=Tagetes erecta TaxID=13708 RepID=A0AAD8P9P7_TARER|nr:hypothetical protein QVD17_03133 [Tagetes erecta]
MATATLELEFASQFPPEKAFKSFTHFDEIAPKVIPHVFKSFDAIHGNGEVGTIKNITFGEAVPFTSGKYKVEAIDESTYTYSTSFFEGDNLYGIFDSINHHYKITPSANGGSVVKQTVTYKSKGDEKVPEEILKKEKEQYEGIYQAMEAFAAANPQA